VPHNHLNGCMLSQSSSATKGIPPTKDERKRLNQVKTSKFVTLKEMDMGIGKYLFVER